MRIAGITTLLAALTLIVAAPASAQPTCGEVITQNTTLTADLNCIGQGSGVTIGAPGITLDLGGHRISTYETAVNNPGYADVTIRNGSITFDTRGVVLTGATRNTVRDIAIDGLVVGIELRNSDGNRIVSTNLLSALIEVDENSDGNVLRDNVTRGTKASSRSAAATTAWCATWCGPASTPPWALPATTTRCSTTRWSPRAAPFCTWAAATT